MEKRKFIENSIKIVMEYYNKHNKDKINVTDIEIEDMECIDNDKQILLYINKVPEKLFEIIYNEETNTLTSNIIRRKR